MDKDTLQKIASATPGVLTAGSQLVKKLANDNLELVGSNEALEHSLRIHKLAMRMEERKLEPGLTVTEKVAMLEKTPVAKLAGIEAAVEMQAGGFKLADLRIEEDSPSSSTQMRPGEIGSSAHYESLDQRIQNL